MGGSKRSVVVGRLVGAQRIGCGDVFVSILFIVCSTRVWYHENIFLISYRTDFVCSIGAEIHSLPEENHQQLLFLSGKIVGHLL